MVTCTLGPKTGQYGCNSSNSPSSWNQSPSYTDALSGVRAWTGDITGTDGESCRPTNGDYTYGDADARWQAESIVDGTVGMFSYPNTQITAFLCSSVVAGGGPMNNSSPPGAAVLPAVHEFLPDPIRAADQRGVRLRQRRGHHKRDTTSVPYGIMNGQAAVEYDMTQDSANLCTSHH